MTSAPPTSSLRMKLSRLPGDILIYPGVSAALTALMFAGAIFGPTPLHRAVCAGLGAAAAVGTLVYLVVAWTLASDHSLDS